MTAIPSLSLFLTLAALTTCVPGQRVWRVNCAGGPNVDYTDLPPAVAAASPGDTIWLYYDTVTCPSVYSSTIVDKPIAIVGFHVTGGAPGYSIPTRAGLDGLLTIQNIPAGTRVTISNFSIHPRNVWPPQPHGINAVNCDGEIVLEDVYYNGVGYSGSVVIFDDCSKVTLSKCDFWLSGSPLTLIDASVLITNSVIRWHHATMGYPYQYAANHESVLVRNSNATAIYSLIDGPSILSNLGPNYEAQPAAVIESGTLTIGPFSVLRGGSIGYGFRANSLYMPYPSQAQVFFDSRAYPLVNTGPLQTPPPTPATVHATYHDHVVGGELYEAGVFGPPNGWALMAVGSASMQPVNLGFGWLAMDPLSVLVLGLKQLDSVGWNEWIQRCPAVVPVGHALAFQAAVLAPNGAITLTVPSPFTVGWPHGQIP